MNTHPKVILIALGVFSSLVWKATGSSLSSPSEMWESHRRLYFGLNDDFSGTDDDDSSESEESASPNQIKNVLVLASAAMSLIKAIFSMISYSENHAVILIVGLVCTCLACVSMYATEYCFSLSSYFDDDYYDNLYNNYYGNGDDDDANDDDDDDGIDPEEECISYQTRNIYLLALLQACATLWRGIQTTKQTVRFQVRFQNSNRQEARKVKKRADSAYFQNFLLSLLLGSVVPVLLVWKMELNLDFFGPFNFSESHGNFLLIANLCLFASSIPSVWGAFGMSFAPFLRNPSLMLDSALPVEYKLSKWFFLAFVMFLVLTFRVLADVETMEAGALLHLWMMVFVQNVEGNAELMRVGVWGSAVLGVDLPSTSIFASTKRLCSLFSGGSESGQGGSSSEPRSNNTQPSTSSNKKTQDEEGSFDQDDDDDNERN